MSLPRRTFGAVHLVPMAETAVRQLARSDEIQSEKSQDGGHRGNHDGDHRQTPTE